MSRPYVSGHDWGFVCECDGPDVGKPFHEPEALLSDGDTVTCPYCEETYRVNITKVTE